MNVGTPEVQFPAALLGNMHVIAIVLDREANLLHCNDYLLALTGWRADEILNRNWFDVFAPDDAVDARASFTGLLERLRVTWQQNSRILTKSRACRVISWNNAVIHDANGRATGTASIGVDISERLSLERELLESGARERERLAREMHEGLGQDLFAVGLYASSLASGVARGTYPTSNELTALADRVAETIGACRRIAYGLSPLSRIQGGLIEALRQMTKMPPYRGGSALHLEILERGPLRLTLDELDHVYRIAQEALANAVRHASASQIVVRLEIAPKFVHLSVTDDGSGLPQRYQRGAGGGLKTMEYRASLLQAALSIGNVCPQGTRVSCRVPQIEETHRVHYFQPSEPA